MKRNKMMRLASVLLVAVLLTTCAISGTFAKYVTSAEAEENARVAKFGVTFSGTNTSAFSTSYISGTASYTADTVVSSDDDEVVAPGTSGSLATVTASGTPEVAVTITYSAELDLGDNWVVDGNEYCPIVFTVGETQYKIDGTNITSVAALEAAVEDAIGAYTATSAANTALSAATPAISWAWAYESGNDAKDTALGDAAADGKAATIDLSVTATVTQID